MGTSGRAKYEKYFENRKVRTTTSESIDLEVNRNGLIHNIHLEKDTEIIVLPQESYTSSLSCEIPGFSEFVEDPFLISLPLRIIRKNVASSSQRLQPRDFKLAGELMDSQIFMHKVKKEVNTADFISVAEKQLLLSLMEQAVSTRGSQLRINCKDSVFKNKIITDFSEILAGIVAAMQTESRSQIFFPPQENHKDWDFKIQHHHGNVKHFSVKKGGAASNTIKPNFILKNVKNIDSLTESNRDREFIKFLRVIDSNTVLMGSILVVAKLIPNKFSISQRSESDILTLVGNLRSLHIKDAIFGDILQTSGYLHQQHEPLKINSLTFACDKIVEDFAKDHWHEPINKFLQLAFTESGIQTYSMEKVSTDNFSLVLVNADALANKSYEFFLRSKNSITRSGDRLGFQGYLNNL
jgi:hypothetical protein